MLRNPLDWATAMHRQCWCAEGDAAMAKLPLGKFLERTFKERNEHPEPSDGDVGGGDTCSSLMKCRERKCVGGHLGAWRLSDGHPGWARRGQRMEAVRPRGGGSLGSTRLARCNTWGLCPQPGRAHPAATALCRTAALGPPPLSPRPNHTVPGTLRSHHPSIPSSPSYVTFPPGTLNITASSEAPTALQTCNNSSSPQMRTATPF
eukprot:365810-Chlamydomonas_euryale.AAC.35